MYKLFFCLYRHLLFVMLPMLALCCQGAYAQQNVKFTHITTDNGLSQNTVPAILKDKYGFMWFGTEEGLNRYDGYHFIVYRNNPKDKNSIAGNGINVLYQDKAGNLWVGTRDGLSFYNRANDSFVNYYSVAGNPKTLSNNSVTAIREGEPGVLWIGTYQGLDLLNQKTNEITRHADNGKKPGNLSIASVTAIIKDGRQRLWVGTETGLSVLNNRTGNFTTYLHNDQDAKTVNSNFISALADDGKGNIWVGTHDKGIDKLDPETGVFQHHEYNPAGNLGLSNNTVFSITPTENGCLWIGTEYGLDFYNSQGSTFTTYTTSTNDNSNLSVASVRAIFMDSSGILWVSTFEGGINKYDKNLPLFNVYHYQVGNARGLTYGVISSFADAGNGKIWVGTDGAGLDLLNNSSRQFTHYMHQQGSKNTISSNAVIALLKSKTGNGLWIGTYAGGLDLFDTEKQTFTVYAKGNGDNQLSDDRVFALLEDKRNNLWIGTNGGGVNVLNLSTQKITRYMPEAGNEKSVSNKDIRCFFEDRDGDIWIGTYSGGISIYHWATNTFTHLTKANSNLSSDIVYCFSGDRNGNIWVGTFGGGLDKYDRVHNKFTAYTTENGLSNNSVNSIIEDDKGFLWISTDNDLNRFDAKNNSFKNYRLQNGLQNHEFSLNAGFKAITGEIYFGGISGFNIINPDVIPENKNIPPVVITDFRLFNKSVVPGAENSPLKQSIVDTRTIRLNYTQSVFTFEFSALDYTIHEKNQYAYKLENFEKDWNYVGNEHKATYTNLNPGEYVFRVKAANNDGVWNQKGVSIKIIIVPPFWLTWWFKLLAVLFTGFFIYVIFQFRTKSVQEQKQALEKQVAERTYEVLRQAKNLQLLNTELQASSKEMQAQSEKLISLNTELLDQTEELQILNEDLHEQRIQEQRARLDAEEARSEADKANHAKSTFLATMSHEIRTPMNGVIGMASLLVETELSAEQFEYTENIINSGEALLKIINDILDFSKIESGKMELDPHEFELRFCVEEVLDMFAGNAVEYNIDLICRIDDQLPDLIIADSLRLRQILVNLLGNAMKFTHKGEIFLDIALASETGDILVITFDIIDTGIGISEEKLSNLFKPFTQLDSSTTRRYGGTGLGLAITKRLVELLGGEIRVKSTEGNGSKFSFNIKCQVQSRKRLYSVNLPDIKTKHILIVDDNNTYLQVLKAQLDFWNLHTTAVNSGAEALKLLQGPEVYNLVITDMQMPEMNGIELSRQIKSVHPQIPVILLSSLGDDSMKKHPDLFVAMLTKPVKRRQLSLALQTGLNESPDTATYEYKKAQALSPDFAENYPLKILVAEDNLINQKLIIRILTKLGYEPKLANNGLEVLEFLAEKIFDVILMDIQMPGMDGLEATRSIRNDSAIGQPYIIAMTANAMSEDRTACYEAGMNNYISKPIKLDLFIAILKEGYNARTGPPTKL